MKRAGIVRQRTIYSSRVKDWPTHIGSGYETESDIYSRTINLRIWRGDRASDKEYEAMIDKAQEAVEPLFVYTTEAKGLFVVTGEKAT